MGDLRLAVVVVTEHIRDSFHVLCPQCALLHVEDQRRLRGELQNLGPFLLRLLQDVLVVDIDSSNLATPQAESLEIAVHFGD